MKETTFLRRVLALTIVLALPSSPIRSQVTLSGIEDFESDLMDVPCENDRRLEAVERLFQRLGAPPTAMSVDTYQTVRNLVTRIEGTSPEMIVIGAHYDKAPEGCGAVDNWTGVVAMARMYKTLAAARMSKTLLFVAFGLEEKGLLGSKAMTAAIPKGERRRYCAMINLDSFGRSAPQVLDNASSPKLRQLGGDLAKAMNIPFTHAVVIRADTDSSAFRRLGIPALALHGLSRDYLSVLHSKNDQSSNINPGSVYLGYRLALGILARVDEAPCAAFR